VRTERLYQGRTVAFEHRETAKGPASEMSNEKPRQNGRV
jgi:hypothetical protein